MVGEGAESCKKMKKIKISKDSLLKELFGSLPRKGNTGKILKRMRGRESKWL